MSEVRGLFNSWATPATNSPTAESFSLWTNWACVARRISTVFSNCASDFCRFSGHVIEDAGQLAQFILGMNVDALGEIAAADGFGAVAQMPQGLGHAPHQRSRRWRC